MENKLKTILVIVLAIGAITIAASTMGIKSITADDDNDNNDNDNDNNDDGRDSHDNNIKAVVVYDRIHAPDSRSNLVEITLRVVIVDEYRRLAATTLAPGFDITELAYADKLNKQIDEVIMNWAAEEGIDLNREDIIKPKFYDYYDHDD